MNLITLLIVKSFQRTSTKKNIEHFICYTIFIKKLSTQSRMLCSSIKSFIYYSYIL